MSRSSQTILMKPYIKNSLNANCILFNSIFSLFIISTNLYQNTTLKTTSICVCLWLPTATCHCNSTSNLSSLLGYNIILAIKTHTCHSLATAHTHSYCPISDIHHTCHSLATVRTHSYSPTCTIYITLVILLLPYIHIATVPPVRYTSHLPFSCYRTYT